MHQKQGAAETAEETHLSHSNLACLVLHWNYKANVAMSNGSIYPPTCTVQTASLIIPHLRKTERNKHQLLC